MFDQLKPLMQNGERYIVVEGDRPEYVIMRFQDYSELLTHRKSNPGHRPVARSLGEWERANAELDDLGRESTVRSAEFRAEPIPPAVDPSTIRLEDLPL